MRKELTAALVERVGQCEFVFLTSDLGFMALEPLRDALGERFINCGVAEQNTVAVAAGLARSGLDVWVYNIAPFGFARPFEQIRNDLCFHRLPVKLIGNGGGYAYGVMGPTHHALEDLGALLSLAGMRVFVPAFGVDVAPAIEAMSAYSGPSYLRLGRDELPKDAAVPHYAPWRRLISGSGGGAVVALGPIAGLALEAVMSLRAGKRPDLWVVAEMPFGPADLPDELVQRKQLCVVEEHVRHGGLGQALCHRLVERGSRVEWFRHLHARGYPSGRYGSQNYHRRESGLDVAAILGAITEMEG